MLIMMSRVDVWFYADPLYRPLQDIKDYNKIKIKLIMQCLLKLMHDFKTLYVSAASLYDTQEWPRPPELCVQRGFHRCGIISTSCWIISKLLMEIHRA